MFGSSQTPQDDCAAGLYHRRVTTEPDDVPETAEELQLVVGVLVRQMRSASPARDITLSQISILKRLDREGPRTVAELARADKITHQSVAATVAALVERDLVQRGTDAGDLRRKRLTVTDGGRALLGERREAGYGHLASLIATRLDPDERRLLTQAVPLLRRLIT
jgi:DNA-binding MarR family transcriptional regulator